LCYLKSNVAAKDISTLMEVSLATGEKILPKLTP